jgi:diguanylate cyclase
MIESSLKIKSSDVAAEYFRLSLAKLGQLKLAITPINYALVYYYISGDDIKLNARLDDLFADIDNWSDDEAKVVFSQFISPRRTENDHHLEQSLLITVAQILGLVVDISGSSVLSNDALAASVEKLAVCKDPKDILDIASQIVAQTRKFVKKTRQFEKSVRERSDEIHELKGQLDKARKQATIDALTGLHNRRGFDETLAKLLSEDNAGLRNGAIILLDIDYFKQVNDTYGHLVGDKVLVGIGQQLLKQMRGSDYLSRFGGEEFAILVLETPLSGAFTVAENLRKSISRLRWRHPKSGNEVAQITISIGIADIRTNDTVEALLERCDEALYKAKSSGRNRSVIAQ